jgi:hypothetical protein
VSTTTTTNAPILDDIPAELKERPQWIVWRNEARAGGPTKVPYQPRCPGRRAKTNDPGTWASLEAALDVFSRGGWDGIGYVFSPDDPYCGADFDGCLEGGELAEWASTWLAELAGAYGEVSPSGRGIKFFCRAKLAGTGGKRAVGDGEHTGIEVYDRGRFFAVTGNAWCKVEEIADCQAAIDRLNSWVKAPKSQSQANGQPANGPSSRPSVAKLASAEERARAYARTIDPAISGQGGHDKTFYAACKLGPGFDLPRDLALRIILEEYNPRCDPPWSRRELEHKIDSAYERENDRGCLLRNGQDGRARGTFSKQAPTAGPLVRSNGQWISCLHNSKLWLEDPARSLAIRYDTFTHMILVNGKPLSDELVIALAARIEAETRSPWNQEHVRSAVVDIAHGNEFSAQIAWLDSLEWDGRVRLNHFFQEAYDCAQSEYATACARVFFLSAVARAYEPGCQADVMNVLIGPQGIGKSMGIAKLCPFPAWFTDDLPDLHDRKPTENLRGKWIVEFSEFSRINRAAIETVKSFLTRRVDSYRPAYGRGAAATDFPRTNIFVGTTNHDHPLQDTENRRFMPITCPRGNLDWIAENRDQLWAEAVERYRMGEQWWVADPNLVAEVASRQEEARQGDCWESILSDGIGSISSVKMEDAARILGIDRGRIDQATEMRIGQNLKPLGFIRRRKMKDGVREYVWERP